MLTQETIDTLIALGVEKQRARSATTEAVVNALMQTDGKLLIQEAKNQVKEMRELVLEAREQYSEISDVTREIAETQKKFGNITDEKAQNALALYAALIAINERIGAKSTDSVTACSYIAYAYLGGQARGNKADFSQKLKDDKDE